MHYAVTDSVTVTGTSTCTSRKAKTCATSFLFKPVNRRMSPAGLILSEPATTQICLPLTSMPASLRTTPLTMPCEVILPIFQWYVPVLPNPQASLVGQ